MLLERLIVNRPHPWGLLITFIELIKVKDPPNVLYLCVYVMADYTTTIEAESKIQLLEQTIHTLCT